MTPKEPQKYITRNSCGDTFRAHDGLETTPVFLPADGEVSWRLLPSLVSVVPGSTLSFENTYSYITKITGPV